MAYSARTRAEIRDTLLADWASRYAANGQALDTRTGTDAYMLVDGMAVELALFEQLAASLDKEILPDQATYTLDRHAFIEGITRDPPVSAVESVAVTGTPAAVLSLAGKTMSAPDGNVYVVSADAAGTVFTLTLDGSGNGTAYITALLAGAASTQPASTVLTWSSPPTGANSTAVVAGISTPGLDQESNASLAARIIQRRQERPASGNRADWHDWTTDVAGITDALIYQLYSPTYGTGTPGAVYVVPIGAAQGDSPTNTRIPTSPQLTTIAGYIEGTTDVTGSSATGAKLRQLRPVTMAPTDYVIAAPATFSVNVELRCVFSAAYAPPFYNAALVVLNVPSPTTTTCSIAGNFTSVFAPSGVPISVLLNIGTTNYRGGFIRVTPTSVVFDGSNTNFTFSALAAAPVVASVVTPAPGNWEAMRTAIFTEFDNLGPADTSPASRWPTEDTRLRSTLYTSALTGAVVQQLNTTGQLIGGVQGTLAATAVLPVADYQPAALTMAVLGTLSIHV